MDPKDKHLLLRGLNPAARPGTWIPGDGAMAGAVLNAMGSECPLTAIGGADENRQEGDEDPDENSDGDIVHASPPIPSPEFCLAARRRHGSFGFDLAEELSEHFFRCSTLQHNFLYYLDTIGGERIQKKTEYKER